MARSCNESSQYESKTDKLDKKGTETGGEYELIEISAISSHSLRNRTAVKFQARGLCGWINLSRLLFKAQMCHRFQSPLDLCCGV